MNFKKKRAIIIKIISFSFLAIIFFCSELLFGQQPPDTRTPSTNPTEGTVTHELHGPNTNCPIHGNRAHTGMDIGAAAGTPVVATGDGTVETGNDPGTNGIWARITHGDDNNHQTFYGHLRDVNVENGQTVTQGQEIGTVGQTGNATGPCLHYQIRENRAIENPRNHTDYPGGTQPGGGGGGDADPSGPGGDHPDETFSVNGMIFPIIDTTNKSYMTKDYVGILYNGYPIATSLLAINYQAIAPREPNKLNLEEIKKFPAFIIPTGGFYGLENSEFLKTTLEEYVKQGGVLIAFAQQHGYEFSILPVPEETDGSFKKVTGYGWTEDQSCFAGSVYIDTYHQILSGQNSSTPSLNVDGYFTNYPSDSIILLRRTSNGQPAMIMYDYGFGKVIAISMYTDWAYGNSQASNEEKALVRDIISWAKEPAQLPEVKSRETVSFPITVTNNTSTDAASIKLSIIDPNRNIISEQIVPTFVPGGQTASIPFTYSTPYGSPLGIWWVDYTLLDAQSNIIQAQTETYSGRFVVSNLTQIGYQGSGITFSIQSDSEQYAVNSMATFMIIGFNHSDVERTVFATYDGQNQTFFIPPRESRSITYSKIVSQSDILWVTIYDGNTFLGKYSKIYRVYKPSVNIIVQTEKTSYNIGETVNLSLNLQNSRSFPCSTILNVKVLDPLNSVSYNNNLNINLPANGSSTQQLSFTLSPTAQHGFYIVSAVVYDGSGGKIGGGSASFELPRSLLHITHILPSTFTLGPNTISFAITNIGKVNVSSGTLDLTLKAPDGGIVDSGSQPFSIAVGESKTLDVPITISSLKWGDYTLSYSQSDETKTGNARNITLSNSVNISSSFDKLSYRVRETANLKVDLKNPGKFNLENISVTVSAPDANYSDTQTIPLGVNSSIFVNYTIPIPETISAGLHNVDILLTLPGGASIPRHVGFVVPESVLSMTYQGTATPSAGDQLSLVLENTGGVDTNYDSYVDLFNDMGFWMETNTGSGLIQAGTQRNITYTLPDQLTNGGYTLGIEVIDQKTNKTTSQYTSLSVTGLSGELSVRTDKDIYFSNEETSTLSTIVNQGKPIANGNLHLEIVCAESAASPLSGGQSFHIYTLDNNNWTEQGVLHFPPYLYRQELSLPISIDQGGGSAYIRMIHEGAEIAFIDYVALRDSNGNLHSPYWVVANEHDITPEVQAEDDTLAEVTRKYVDAGWIDLPSGVSYTLVMRAWEGNACGIVWETDTTINQGSGMTDTLNISAGTIGQAGKFYLKGELTNNLGQIIDTSYYPFYIMDGDAVLLFNTDKGIYRPGEAVTITGRIENRAPITAENLTLTLYSARIGQSPQLFLTETINLLSGGNYPFTITRTAEGEEGVVNLGGTVKQNNQTLVMISDQYEVANPLISTYVDIPEIAKNEPFTIGVEIYNDGKVDATVQFGVQSSEFVDSQTITIPAFGMKLLQYSQQISKDVTYTFTFAGDYEETVTITVSYGLGASIQLGVGGPDLGIFSEGSVAIPVTLTNTGQSTETLEVTYQLDPGATQQSKTYSLPVGGSTIDTLYFDLSEGDYQITATSQRPDATAQASFSVRKENQVEMAVSVGAQTDVLIPININVTNLGYNSIEGSLQLSAINSQQVSVWNVEEPLTQLLPQNSQLITLNINPSTIDPGDYNLEIELLNNSNQQLAVNNQPLIIKGATFQITQLPPYQTFTGGQEATFTFRVKNTGNQEGPFDLRLKSYDLIDSTQREWLKPGEEKALTFGFMLPEDLEEKDYFATYELKAQSSMLKGQIKYHLAGISLNVNASLDKPYYSDGETAHLTINIQSNNPNPQNLFARVNYAGYEPQQTFTLSGSQVLIFDVPLTQITGEKLFYGIYHESGRSIYLNSLYIHKAGDVITITTDKQVYQPGDIVTVSVSGNTSGDMTLSGPGGYTETFTFTGSATKSFTLPATVAAGTYFINYQLSAISGENYTGNYPFDIAGIQVKVLECQNDKGKYASSDTITTTFTISSNTTMPAVLKAWIVDPTGQYTSVGEQSISLSSLENSLITYNSPLITSVSGIHRLVFGIYGGIYGSGDMLLCSGSEAFDVGDAVLMGLSTDKKDYATNTEPVTVIASLYGSVISDLQLELDGNVIKNESIPLSGFYSYQTQLQNIVPGPHTLKATLTAGGLKSIKETTFTYALAYMPKPQISASPAYLDFGSISLGSTSTQTTTLSSTGNVDLVIGTITLSGTNQGEFSIQNDTCSGRTLTPSGNCTIDNLFSPSSLGTKSASLSIPSNATDTPSLYLPLEGTGATTLNLSINPTDSGSVTGTGIDCPGDCTENFSTSGASIQLTATPSEGYQFVNWTGDINLTDNPVTLNMDTHKNVTANFTLSAYTITITGGLGGIITPSGPVTVNPGGSLTITITPDAGYHVLDVLMDGVSVGAVTTYTLSNIASNHTIDVFFAINQYTLIATAGPNGIISPSGSIIVNHGGSQTFTIIPNLGCHIVDVKVDGASVGAVPAYTFSNITSNHTIDASFAISQYTLTATAGPNGTITPAGSVTVSYGGSQTFTITPNAGYRILDVEVDGGSLGVATSYTFINVTSDHTISAAFKGIQVVSLPFSDNFDNDTVGVQPNPPWDNLNGGPAMVTNTESHSPPNSISVSGGPMSSESAFVNLGGTYPDTLGYEIWVKVNSASSSAFIGFFEPVLNMIPQFNTVYFNGDDGRVYFYSDDSSHGFMVPLLNNFAIGVWHKVHVEIDFVNLVADVFIDDILVGSGLPVSPKDATWDYQGTHSFQPNKIGVIHHLGSPFYFDDFSVFEWNLYTPVGLLRSAGPGQWAVLGMGGIGSASNTNISMSGSSSVKGTVAHVGVANAGNVSMSGSSLINGTLFLNTAGHLSRSGTSRVAGGVVQNTATDAILDQAVADALAASQSAAALPATITSITSINITNPSQNITITGSEETNVLHLTKLNITSGTLTLSAPTGGSFIINISSNFNLSGGSRIVLAGGITPSDVLYNIVGSGGNVSMSGGSAVSGILLAPQRGISNSTGVVTGEVIGGGSQISSSGTGQVNNPGP